MSGGARGLFERAERQTVPLSVTVELTRRCGFRCRHCYLPDLGNPVELPTGRILRLLDELAEAGTLFLGLTGGEPLLRGDWPTIAAHARGLGFAVELLTSAAPLDEAAALTLAELRVLASVSLHSVDAGVFEAVTGVPGSLARTLDGIDHLLRHGVEVQLKVPLSTINAESAEAVFAFARGIGAACEAYPLITARSDGDLLPLALRLSQDLVEEHYRRPSSTCPRPGASGAVADDEPLCAAGTRAAHVTVTGDVLACIDLPTAAGNLMRQSFREVWESSPWLARLRTLRRSDLRGCGDCVRLAYCGRCHAQALHEDGDLLGPSSWACGHADTLERVEGPRGSR